jgi:hypothetical protein
MVTNATANAGTASAPPTPAPKATGPSTLERAREAALRNEPAAVRNLLEQRVMSARATTDEVNLVREACKQMGDKACKDAIKAKYPNL